MKQALTALAMLLVMLAGGIAQTLDVTGTWQGKLALPADAPPQPNGLTELRVVFKISKDTTNALRVVMYRIDQTSQGAAGTATVQGTTVSISVPALGANLEGKLSADGNSIAAAVGPAKVPLSLVRATGDALWPIPETPAALRPMPATATPTFDVATIKPARPELQGRAINVRGRDVVAINTALSTLLAFAYRVHPNQIQGLPQWATEEKYEITARPDLDGLPNDRQIRSMFQKLLAERFKLTVHTDKKELPVYALTVARSGAKMTVSAGDPNGLPGVGFGRPGAMRATNAAMSDITSVMQTTVLDRPVVDQTGLTGRYDFTLTWTPDESQFPGIRVQPQPDNNQPNLFTAIQEQIGLRLESTRAPVDVLIVDKVEKPTEN